jgi:aspartate 1-decarboxylase
LRLTIFKSKIHRAVVTMADINYPGSVSIDSLLMKAANIVPYEAVHIWNVTTGTRLITYALGADPGSGIICVNGAAAHLNRAGEIVILATFAEMDPSEAADYQPVVVCVDALNRVSDGNTGEPVGAHCAAVPAIGGTAAPVEQRFWPRGSVRE